MGNWAKAGFIALFAGLAAAPIALDHYSPGLMKRIGGDTHTSASALKPIPVIKKKHSTKKSKMCDISYSWTSSKEAAVDYRSNVSKGLGRSVAYQLHIVQGKRYFGVVYDFNADCKTARKVAGEHAKTLESRGLNGGAIAFEDWGSKGSLYNISFGQSSNLGKLTDAYSRIKKNAERVRKNIDGLTITYTADGRYELVLPVLQDFNDATYAARNLWAITGINASVTRETNFKPVKDIDRRIKKLRSAFHREDAPTALDELVTTTFKDLNRTGVLPDKTSTAVYDLTDNEQIVDYNSNAPMQTGNMIWPAVLTAFFHEVNEGKIEYGPISKAKIEQILQGDTAAINWAIDVIADKGKDNGSEKIQNILNRHYAGIFPQTHIVEKVPKRWNYQNTTSAQDIGKYLHALWNDKLPYSNVIKTLMGFPDGDKRYNSTRLYDRTRTTGHLVGGIGIGHATDREGRSHQYAFVTMVQHPNNIPYGGRRMNSIMSKVADFVAKYIPSKPAH